ncbi:MAG: O-antigen ligase family protein [Planctomycetes bacterium]|nr:O-antigen ligase family protein [Planctomycetota bacterium]
MTESKTVPLPLLSADLQAWLDKCVTAIIAFAAALRPLSMGQPENEVETVFICTLVWIAFFLWGIRFISACRISLANALPLSILGGFAILTVPGVMRVTHIPFAGVALDGIAYSGDGNMQAALDTAFVWFSDFALVIMVAAHFRDKARLRLLCSCVIAGFAAVAVYSLYQKCYGLSYFREYVLSDGNNISLAAGSGEMQQTLFRNRVESDRIYGPFSYPNALAGFLILLCPLLIGVIKQNGKGFLKIFAKIIFCISLLVFIYTGSKAGFLAAKVVECLILYLLADKKGWRVFLACSGYTALATTLCACVAAIAYKLSGSWITGAQTVFAALWLVELKLALRFINAEKGTIRKILPACNLILIAGLAAAVWLIAGWGIDNQESRLGKLHAVVRKNVDVRYNYWRAAFGMIETYPLRGVGLDNFGSRYTQFKPAEGWAVKKVHNHYLQLATDGGIPLLTFFVSFWFILIRTSLKQTDEEVDDNTQSAKMKKAKDKEESGVNGKQMKQAVLFALALFSFIYFMSLKGAFAGLSFEFFLHEVFAIPGKGSLRSITGSWLPAFIHGGVHLVILPATWAGAFYASCRMLDSINPRKLLYWLALCACGLLVHGIADFHPGIASISFFLWLIAGMIMAASDKCGIEYSLPRGAAWAMLLVFSVVVIWQLKARVTPHLANSIEIRSVDMDTDIVLSQSRDKLMKAASELEPRLSEIIALRPRDGSLYRLKIKLLGAEMSIPQGSSKASLELEQKYLEANSMAIACDPYFASGYANLADILLMMGKERKANTTQALAAIKLACALHPYKPIYFMKQGILLQTLGKKEEASQAFDKAKAINSIITDERSLLDEEELRQLDFFLGMHRK